MLMSQKLGSALPTIARSAEQSEIARAVATSPVPGILEARADKAPSEAVPEEPAAVVLAEPAGLAPETATK